MLQNTSSNYGSVAKFFHWLIFFLVFLMLCVGFFMDDISDKALRSEIVNLHKLTGLTILILMVLRLLWTLVNPKPALPLGTPDWQKSAERTVQFLIYATLIAMPIVGWVMVVAGGHPPHIFDFMLRLPIAQSKAVRNIGGDIHFYLAWVIILLVSIHILAALYHHFIKKDEVLRRMMP